MAKKIFRLASILLLTLFVLTAFFRWQASERFLELTNYEPTASRENYTLATTRYEKLSEIARIGCYIYPVIGLICAYFERKQIKAWLIGSGVTLLLSAMALYAVSLLTDGRVGRMDITLYLLSCMLPFLKVFLPCLLLWLIVGKSRKV